ncbi:hypothetical protein FOXB_13563 [Fusarium oxysporum f. sp. conglutinans Fo5176]|uniref:C2H2-type domain-containing protein n=1 Tax=Fusarium oxysporum (strain Fo5176) TaxID=660025 RepID=F9G4I1_FUSOF|nr:hypothetical protein FOXB_13563 [Fusarium oxysporum f. sp. conglutinans Fo5176]
MAAKNLMCGSFTSSGDLITNDTSFPDLDLFDNTEWLYGAGILDQPERYDDPPALQYFPNDGGEVMEHGHHLQINAEEPLSEKRLRTTDKRRTRKFFCSDCTLSFGSQNDVNRHRSSIHDRRRPYVCQVPGCRRGGLGFSRKDNFMVHLRDVHGTQAMDQSLAEGIDKMGARELSDYAQGCPREELLQLVLQQQATCERERQKRRAVEEELGKQKQMYITRVIQCVYGHLLLTIRISIPALPTLPPVYLNPKPVSGQPAYR